MVRTVYKECKAAPEIDWTAVIPGGHFAARSGLRVRDGDKARPANQAGEDVDGDERMLPHLSYGVAVREHRRRCRAGWRDRAGADEALGSR